MTSLRSSVALSLGLAALAGGCGDPMSTSMDAAGLWDGYCDRDSCSVRLDSSWVDAGLSDVGTGDIDSGTTDVDSGEVDGGGDIDTGLPSCAGIECTGFAAVLAAAPRGATSLDNCVIQLHQTDCCGATAAYGINHGARTTLCPAEATCVAGYPDPVCTNDTITTDTGETTTVADDVRLRLTAGGICETFVCTTGSCRSAPGIAGGCGAP